MDPIAFKLAGIEVRWYSLLILISAILVLIISIKEAKKFNIKGDFIFNMLFWAFIFGFIGARLYYCVFNFKNFKDDPVEILRVWNGGLAIHGGLIFGLLAIIIYSKKYGARPIRMLDIIAPSILLAQAIGRWGNFFNGEAHGAATTVERLKSLLIPDFIIKGMTIDGIVYFPSFLFESIFCLIGFIVLLFVRKGKYTKVGSITAGYLVIYGLIRFFIEIGRTDALMLGPLKMAQVISVIMFIVGLGILMFLSKTGKFEDLYNDKNNMESIRF